jgi:predicted negative regulator of RcsB-dependent stress response
MKSKRRHELEQNELADWLAATIAGIKPYQNLILGVVLVLVVAGAGYAWWARQSGTQNAEAWDQFYAAFDSALHSGDVAKLATVTEQYPNTPAAHWAAVVAGDLHLADGCNKLFESKASGNNELRKAMQYYMTVLDQSRNSTLRERATYGLARAREALGELEAAGRLYQQVKQDWPDGAYAAAAANRLADLEKPATKAMYDRFAKFDPKPAFLDGPGTPGQRPPFQLEDLPEGGPLYESGKAFNLRPKAAEESKGADEKKGADEQKPEEPKSEKVPEPSTEPAAANPPASQPGSQPAAAKPDLPAPPPEKPAAEPGTGK